MAGEGAPRPERQHSCEDLDTSVEHTNEDAGAGSGMRPGTGEDQDAGGGTRSGAGDGKGAVGARPAPAEDEGAGGAEPGAGPPDAGPAPAGAPDAPRQPAPGPRRLPHRRSAPPASAPASPAGSGGRPRPRRWVRRIALTAVVAVVVATVASFTYNAFTSGRARTPAGLSYVQAGDVRTRYETWGHTGTPIVLVHGAFESADTWSRLAPLLARDHRVYALDLTGSGYSRRRGPYTAAVAAAVRSLAG